MQNDKSLQQSFTATQLGLYTLSFNYATRPGYILNNMKIYLNGVLLDTVTTTPTNWSTYSNTSLSPILGTNTILFQGVSTGNEGDVALTNIKVFFGQTGGAAPLATASANCFKSTYIYGGFTVYDQITATTPPLTIPASITTQRTYNFSYTTIPTTITTSSLGCVSQSSVAATTVTAGSFTPSTGLSIPVRIYIADSFCVFTPTSGATHILQLGIYNILGSFTGALTSYNSTIENTLVASNLPH